MNINTLFDNPHLTLYSKQKEVVKDLLIKKSSLLYGEMGTGKTLCACYLIKGWLTFGLVKKVVIVCKNEVLYKFKGEIIKHVPGIGEKDIRVASLEDRGLFDDMNYTIFMSDYNNFKNSYFYYVGNRVRMSVSGRKLPVKKVFPIDDSFGVILDEVQYIKNYKSDTFKIIRVNTKDARARVGMSGTLLEIPEELWAVCEVIDPSIFNRSYFSYLQTIAATRPNSTQVLYYREEGVKKAFLTFNPHVVKMKKEDIGELVTKEIIDINVPLEGDFRKKYEDMKNRVIEELSKNPGMTLAHFISKIYNYIKFPDESNPRFTRFTSLVNRLIPSEKLIIWEKSPPIIEALTDYFNSRGVKSLYICGEIEKVERNGIIDRFNSEKDIRLFIVSPITTGDSWEIPSREDCKRCIFYSLPDRGILYEQAMDRIFRINSKAPVTIYRMLMKDTIDYWAKELLEYKMALADGTLNAGDFKKLEDQSYLRYLGVKKSVFGRRWGSD